MLVRRAKFEKHVAALDGDQADSAIVLRCSPRFGTPWGQRTEGLKTSMLSVRIRIGVGHGV